MHSSRHWTLALRWCLVLLSLGTLLAMSDMPAVEARYLPTRADETDLLVLKDLIRALIEQSKLDQGLNEGRLYYQHQGQQQQQQRPAAAALQLQRRSMEVAQLSDGDNLFRSVGGAPNEDRPAGSNILGIKSPD